MRRPASPFILVPIFLLPGCSNPGHAGWHEPRDPPIVGEATLSLFEGDSNAANGESCRWMQIDPVGGSRRVLLTMENECSEPRLVMSPDGRSAAVTDQYADDPAVYEVSLVSGSWRRLPTPHGSIGQLFWREGVLYLIATWEEPASWMTRIGLTGRAAETVTRTLRLEGQTWAPSDEPAPDQAVLNHLDSSAVTGNTSLPEFPAPPKRIADKLAKQFGSESWRQVAPNAFMAWNAGDEGGPLVFQRADGTLQAAGEVDEFVDTTYTMEMRGHWLLMSEGGMNPRLFDLETGTEVYHSQEAQSVTLWPRP